ncbi:MAG: DnaB-like helicase C-terminal domain-containing protein, partial [Candidatus Paceibacterota bacterium]
MTKGKAHLDKLVAGAVEAEADPDRHVMEEAILATVARHGLEAQALWHGFADLTWSRMDFAAIASALWDGIVEGVAADPVVIRGKLKAADAKVEDAVLAGILDGSKVKDVSVAEAYIRIMDKQDRFRRAEDMVRDMAAAVAKSKESGGDIDAAVAGLLKDIFSLAHKKKLVKEYPVEAEDALDFLKALEHRRADGRDWLGLDCGFKHLNEVLNGLTEGLFILAGAPSCGKTTLAKQIADTVAATEKVPVLFWSFEQSKEELRIKSLSRLASVNSRDIWKGRTDANTWQKVEQAAEAYRRGPGRWLTIIEAGREDTLDRIRGAA